MCFVLGRLEVVFVLASLCPLDTEYYRIHQMNVLVLLAFLSSVVAQSSFKIHHRVFHPSLQPFPYAERGTLIIAEHSATFQPSPSLPDDFAAFFELLQSLESPEHALYQVALGNGGDGQWDFSSVKVVRLIILSRRHER